MWVCFWVVLCPLYLACPVRRGTLEPIDHILEAAYTLWQTNSLLLKMAIYS